MVLLNPCGRRRLLHDVWRLSNCLRSFAAVSRTRRLYRIGGLRCWKVIVLAYRLAIAVVIAIGLATFLQSVRPSRVQAGRGGGLEFEIAVYGLWHIICARVTPSEKIIHELKDCHLRSILIQQLLAF